MIHHITKLTHSQTGRVHYHVYYMSGRKRAVFESTLTDAMISVILNGRSETRYTDTGKVEYFYPV